MKRVNNKKNLYKSIILLVIVVIGIGYAYLTSNLSITGSTEVVANTWDIHFENLNVTTGSVTATTPASIDSNETSITYAITLSRPKEYYEFTVDVVNEGTLPGKVSISELSGLDSTSSKVIDYEVKYTYGQPVNVGDILNGGDTKTIKVKVYYKDDISADDFPENNLNLNLTYTLQYVQSEEDAPSVDDIIQPLKTNNSSCFIKYDGDVTDKVGITEEATKVYFDKCADKRNIIFGGLCWQVIRTTETGGIKVVYNGEPVDGKCESSRGDHLGIKGSIPSYNGMFTELTESYLYGNTFTYDINSNSFTLVDTSSSLWNESTYKDLLGKYTCMNNTGTCSTIKNINTYYSDTVAYTYDYIIDSVNYGLVGTGPFNVYDGSPAMVGYMFNAVYKGKILWPESTIIYGNTFTYDDNTNTYTLTGEIQTIAGRYQDDTAWNNLYNTINNTHYTCWNNTGTCSTLSYIYYSGDMYAYYIELNDGKSVNDAINEMLYNDNVNRYNSTVKGIVDAWYNHNLIDYTNLLEDTVFCNNRDIDSLGSWDPNGGETTYIGNELRFKNYNLNTDLKCNNITDQFSVSNSKAKLDYPISLITLEELYNINQYTLTGLDSYWWGLSPYSFRDTGAAGVRIVRTNGLSGNSNDVDNNTGIRPSISIKGTATVVTGTGSETNPWVVD